jgi:hypothetical protein
MCTSDVEQWILSLLRDIHVYVQLFSSIHSQLSSIDVERDGASKSVTSILLLKKCFGKLLADISF